MRHASVRKRADPAHRSRDTCTGSRILRKANHREEARQRPDRHHHGAPRSAVFSFATIMNVGSAQEVSGDHRPRAHVRAHGVQRHAHIGTTELRGGESRAGRKSKMRTPRTIASAASRSDHDEAKMPQLDKAWKDAIDDAQTSTSCRTSSAKIVDRAGGDGHERLHGRRRDRVLLSACRRIAWSCGPISNPSASSIPCSASSTKSATSSTKSGACAPRAAPSDACSRSSWRPRSPRIRTAAGRRLAVGSADRSPRPTRKHSSRSTTCRPTS